MRFKMNKLGVWRVARNHISGSGGKGVGWDTVGEVGVVLQCATSAGVIGRALADMTGPVV
jgi:hypothetical protein